MDLNVTTEGKSARFTIIGKVDEVGAEELKSRFLSLDRGDLKDLVFDFKEVSHIGSAGIGKLLLFYKELAVAGGDIRIVNASESIRDLFRVLKLDTIFTIA